MSEQVKSGDRVLMRYGSQNYDALISEVSTDGKHMLTHFGPWKSDGLWLEVETYHLAHLAPLPPTTWEVVKEFIRRTVRHD